MKEMIDRIISVEEELQGRTAEAESQAQDISRGAESRLNALEKDFEDKYAADREQRMRETAEQARNLEADLMKKAQETISRKKARILSASNDIRDRIIRMVFEV